MAVKQTSPRVADPIRVSEVICDFQAGALRCVARLSPKEQTQGVKAIWRNEIGQAKFTPQRASRS